jgi:mannonate dehydratase
MNYKMIYSMRWFGDNDLITLSDIRQAGATSVVTALHHIPVGEIWSAEEIAKRKKIIEDAGLNWTVVESLPVHEDIKKRKGNFQIYIENYKQSMKHLAAAGVNVITYNFMPALDWVRTDLNFETPTGAHGLRFVWNAYMSFDLFILQRPDAEKDYTEKQIADAKKYFSELTPQQIENLKTSCLMGLPGSTGFFTRDEVLKLLREYDSISKEELQQNLFYFLNEISAAAEENNVMLAIHPDDPPFPVFGLPRILSTEKHIEEMIKNVPSKNCGLCFCTGSLGADENNNLMKILEKYSDKVYFLHLRSVKHEDNRNFYEANHLEGDADLISIIAQISKMQQQQQRQIPMRPDHGAMISESDKAMYPGYSYIGRLKALAEIRGVEETILRWKEKN